MRKIYVLVGVVLLCVLVLSTWLFIGKIGGWAHILGDQSKKLVEDEQSHFIGSWMDVQNNTLYTFARDGSYYIEDFFVGSWVVNGGNFSLARSDDHTVVSFSYSFSDTDTRLILTDTDGHQTLYRKQ